jgi:hypothetical protein
VQQGRLDLRADDVLGRGVEHATPTALIGQLEPVTPDHDHDDVRRGDVALDHTPPIGAWLQAGSVEKDMRVPDARPQGPRDQARRQLAVTPAIAHEDVGTCMRLRGLRKLIGRDGHVLWGDVRLSVAHAS